jgi:hypothetical protein
MQEAGRLLEIVQAPIGTAVEDFGSHKLVLPDLSVREELLLLLHASHPNRVSTTDLLAPTPRRTAGSVPRDLQQMWAAKLLDGDAKTGYRLTLDGVNGALDVVRRAAWSAWSVHGDVFV